ncbi:MAG: L,D-transpeptidase family protein [Anaerolineales bacterium]|uniref:L,D-transpeptidase family protein n=1 Tax=Candidatus Desulfolinea nitratireducens TaxID=2841698 RepID=A0A8J6TJB5_9CHLR|nr:L,D-transpeptidase family protein [Candidatus Desulfolinea nitratireducens]
MQNLPSTFTRRDFLKFSAAGVLSLLLADLGISKAYAGAPPLQRQGRTTWSSLTIYDKPSFSGKKVNLYGRDVILPITEEMIIEGEHAYNHLWYRIGNEGYAHSANLQPVVTSYNMPVFDIPESGVLAELTIPFVPIRLGAGFVYRPKMRYYYGTTYWVNQIIQDPDDGSYWYRIYDQVTETYYFLPSYSLRIIPDEELAPISPEMPAEEKSLYVDLESQVMVAYEGDTPVMTSLVASGWGGTPTPIGTFSTYHKAPSVHMTDGAGDAANYDLPGVPWVSFFTGNGDAFHGTYWHNDFGDPRSHGCVNTPDNVSKFIYLWTTPYVPPGEDYLHLPGEGTRVEVVDSQINS